MKLTIVSFMPQVIFIIQNYMRPNPSMEAIMEQRKMRVEALRGERENIVHQLDHVLGAGRYAISTDGEVNYEAGELELEESEREYIIGANIRLKEIYQELKELGV